MSARARTRCPEPGCNELVTAGRCAEHRLPSTGKRAPSSVRAVMSGGEWEGIRARQLAAHPLCRCGARAVEVDHVRPISEGGAARDPANLQSLCAAHHKAKTAAEAKRRAAARRRAKQAHADQTDPVSDAQIARWLLDSV